MIKSLIEIFNQRIAVYLVAVFLALVLFNTTYMSLGTIVPSLVIGFTLLWFLLKYPSAKFLYKQYLVFAFIIGFATMLSGGDDYRQVLKIILTVLFLNFATSIEYSTKEIRFLSLMLCVSYSVYAYLVMQSMGEDSYLYGRATITILKGEIPLDPNVTGAVFPLPVVICLYNLMHGKYKFISVTLLAVLLIAIVMLASRGAFLALMLSSSIIVIPYLTRRKTKLFAKILILFSIAAIIYYMLYRMSSMDTLMGLNRIFDTTSESGELSNGRLSVWMERLNLLIDSPIWGYGANYDMGLHRGMASHNTIIQIMHYSGILGTILFIVPLYRLFKKDNIDKSVKYALFASVFASVFFIDTLQERTMWNFIIFYHILSSVSTNERGLIWFEKEN